MDPSEHSMFPQTPPTSQFLLLYLSLIHKNISPCPGTEGSLCSFLVPSLFYFCSCFWSPRTSRMTVHPRGHGVTAWWRASVLFDTPLHTSWHTGRVLFWLWIRSDSKMCKLHSRCSRNFCCCEIKGELHRRPWTGTKKIWTYYYNLDLFTYNLMGAIPVDRH